jgi:hypothetical protein
MDTPITKELQERINKHKDRLFRQAMRAADKIKHPTIAIYSGKEA